jgi:hypothetical protein
MTERRDKLHGAQARVAGPLVLVLFGLANRRLMSELSKLDSDTRENGEKSA